MSESSVLGFSTPLTLVGILTPMPLLFLPSKATKNMNYAQVVFSATKGLKSESSLDYENIKETTDYVNVNPKSHKPNFWTFAKPADSEPVEYTQVAL